MAIQNIAVNTQTLNGDINQIQEALENAKIKAQNMFDDITELSRMWEGGAHDAFSQQFNVDYENLENLFQTITDLVQCMKYANKEYNSCETTIEMIINSLRV